jgi:hypothetical protein
MLAWIRIGILVGLGIINWTGLGWVILKVKIYKTTILPVVFYGCETWSLTLRE